MSSSLQISDQELAIVKTVLQQYATNIPVWAYGSRVKGTAKRYSDLDLALITKEPLTFLQLAKLENAFSDSELEWKVDILDWASASDEFKQIVLQNYIELQ
ncbi:DNA polymerase beta subunit [Pasteurellaceae bacterium 15-036681]|nr:DNA polymerase beta subunit [Pasteurellaceae bacterium 15-036681]